MDGLAEGGTLGTSLGDPVPLDGDVVGTRVGLTVGFQIHTHTHTHTHEYIQYVPMYHICTASLRRILSER